MATSSQARFTLHVPLDASAVKDFKPEKEVKVIAVANTSAVQDQQVRLSTDGKGTANFSFASRPGVLRVAVGPGDATPEELQNLQTISVNVSARAWGERNSLTLSPVTISAYYWWWWLIWCRRFTIRGRVVCPDGSAVPGAQVCAYDVDWWWWWVSEDLIGCAITDATGAFEIDFRWCCGWWPWWWWARRIWRLDPLLIQRIVPVLQRMPTIPRIPLPDPAPDLAIFNDMLAGAGGRALPPAQLAASGPPMAAPGVRRANQAQTKAVDPAAVTALRAELLGALPASAELAQLRIWPWWPWEPWFDCDPDVIFKVMQNCSGQNEVIVDETIWDTRWNIPTSLNVTLVANRDACCIKPCTNPQDCPDGDCLVITDVCHDTVNSIGGNPGAPAAPEGYLNPGTPSIYGDRPYAGVVPIFGIFGAAATADYYTFEYSGNGGVTWNTVPPASLGGFTCQFWGPALPAGPVGWHPVNFLPAVISAQLVIESRAHFEATHDSASWGVTRFWDSNCERLLINWITNGLISDGTYQLRVRSWRLVAGNLQDETVLPLCDTKNDNGVIVTLNNQVVTGPPTNLDGYHCGPGTVHQCTIEPDTAFVSVRLNGLAVGACANVDAREGGSLEIDFVAYDPDAHLAYYTLQALYGDSLVVDLLSVPGATLSTGPATGLVPSCGPQWGPDYGAARTQGAVSPHWKGGVVTLTIPNLHNAFPETCCYTLQLFAHKRTIVSCDHSFWGQYNQSDFSLTVVV
jgi:hypothetical protein